MRAVQCRPASSGQKNIGVICTHSACCSLLVTHHIDLLQVELMQIVIDGVSLLVEMEKTLENGGRIDKLLPDI